jgi:hypothetical protein
MRHEWQLWLMRHWLLHCNFLFWWESANVVLQHLPQQRLVSYHGEPPFVRVVGKAHEGAAQCCHALRQAAHP